MGDHETVGQNPGTDRFERLGRAAGAELRATAPSDGATRAARTVRRRQRHRTAIAATLFVVILVGGVTAIASRNASDVAPLEGPLPVPDTAPTSTSGATGVAADLVLDGEPWIVHEAADGTRQRLMLVRPDGTGLHELVPTLDGGDQEKAFWSPDGASVVFVMPETAGSTGQALWVVGSDGSEVERVLECRGDCLYLDDPAWSPDGRWIVYARMASDGAGTRSTLERIDVGSGAVDVLLTADPFEFYAGPRWSPDGRSLVVEVVRRESARTDADVTGVALAVLDLDADEPALRDLTDRETFGVTPDWSPTGEFIVYAAPPAPDSDATDLYLISPDGGTPTRLTHLADEGGHAAFPAFDSTGDQVIFTARAGASEDYVIASVDRVGGRTRLTLGETVVVGTHARPRP